jgi:hypothetical protein
MGLRAKDIVLSSSASESLRDLESSPDPNSASIVRRIRVLRSILLADCLHGEVVKRDRIPKVLKDRHGLENLFVEDLPSFWRLLYTIVRDRGERYVVVVEIVDHQTYDGWLRGRGR